MKWFVALIVIINLLVGMYGALKQKPAMDIHAQEISPGQIKLLPSDWHETSSGVAVRKIPAASAAIAQKPVASAAVAKQEEPSVAKHKTVEGKPVAVVAKKAPEVEKAQAATVCYAWPELESHLLERVKGGLPSLKLRKDQISEATNSKTAGGNGKYWVYYPQLNTKAETQTLSSELKDKGFDNYIVQNDDFKGVISLGLYGKEASAKSLAAKIKATGFDKVQVVQKGQSKPATTITFTSLSAEQSNQLHALQKRLTPGIPLKSC